MRGKFILFLLFLAIIVGIVGFWYYQKNAYSKEALKLEILGPSQADLLEDVEYTVKFKNNGNITLEDAKLIFEYPKHSIVEQARSLRQQVGLEDIYPGQERTQQFKAKLVGKEQDIKKAKAFLSYRPKNLKASFESETSLTTIIKSAPLSFELDVPSKVEAGREIKFSINYFSSLEYPVSDLRVKMVYPQDFEFIKAKPQGLEDAEWDIGLLNAADGGRIEVTGTLSGKTKEEKLFKASLGVWQGNEFVLLKETTRGTKITKPSLSVFQRINGLEDYVANSGEWLRYEIFFRNIGEEPFRRLFLITNLEGRIFDFDTLKTERGQFNKGDKSIIWDWRDIAQLQFLDQGEEGKVEFLVKLKDFGEVSAATTKPFLRNKVIISEIKEEFEIKIQSKLEIVQKGFYEDEVFGNVGPIPPETGKETTYTIMWQAKNCCSQVKDVKVKTVLPPNVKLTGEFFPEDLRITFDSDSREVIWQVGDLAGGRAGIDELESCAFQVALTPTPLQKGKKIPLVAEARITGEDQWTEEIIDNTASGIDTTLPDDPTVEEEQGVVQ